MLQIKPVNAFQSILASCLILGLFACTNPENISDAPQENAPVETEETQTDIPLMTFDESITITAIVRRRKPARPNPSKNDEVTQTAVVVRRNITQEPKENHDDTAVAYFSELDPGS